MDAGTADDVTEIGLGSELIVVAEAVMVSAEAVEGACVVAKEIVWSTSIAGMAELTDKDEVELVVDNVEMDGEIDVVEVEVAATVSEEEEVGDAVESEGVGGSGGGGGGGGGSDETIDWEFGEDETADF